MYLNTLQHFRHEVYACFQQAADALFNLVDALLTETEASSFPELSLSPFFERQWASLYEALEDGQIDHEGLMRLFVQMLIAQPRGERLVLAVDTTSIARPESETARDRTVVYVPNLPESSKPITYGWQFSTIVALPEQPSSWTAVLDQQRIESAQTACEVALAQLLRLLPLLPARPLLLGDRWYSSARFVSLVAALACDLLVRVKHNQVFYRPAPPPTGKRGAPRKHGARFRCDDPSTHGVADAHWEGIDEREHKIEVTCWNGLHLRIAPRVEVTLIRVIRHGATERKRDPRESWFLWLGTDLLPLDQIYPTYKRRYSHEHGYRFDKQALLWTKPRLRTPEQFERWTDVVAIVHNHLLLARQSVSAQKRPWESTQRPASPQQVRRAMSRIVTVLGTPARPPKPRGKSPGRQKGATLAPAPRYEVVRKGPKQPKKRRKSA